MSDNIKIKSPERNRAVTRAYAKKMATQIISESKPKKQSTTKENGEGVLVDISTTDENDFKRNLIEMISSTAGEQDLIVKIQELIKNKGTANKSQQPEEDLEQASYNMVRDNTPCLIPIRSAENSFAPFFQRPSCPVMIEEMADQSERRSPDTNTMAGTRAYSQENLTNNNTDSQENTSDSDDPECSRSIGGLQSRTSLLCRQVGPASRDSGREILPLRRLDQNEE